MKKAILSLTAALTLGMLLPAEADAQFTVWKDGVAVYALMNDLADSVKYEYSPVGSRASVDESVGGTVPAVAEAVDLGLPSGTLGAPYNVGATKHGEAGAYFAWGETSAGKSEYAMSTYKWTEDDGSTFTKYNAADGKTTLDAEDDAAAANWGGKWQMHTKAQLQEHLTNCSREWKEEGEYAEGSAAGCLFTSKKNGKTLFLPAAGNWWVSALDDLGSDGYYWSSELDSGLSNSARSLYFSSDDSSADFSTYRNRGFSVRAVLSAAE